MEKRRRFYRKHLLGAAGLLYVLGVAGYLLFQTADLRADSVISKKIAEEVQKIKERGEPTTIEELVPPDLPDAENGALVYNQAFSFLKELEAKHQADWKYFPYEGDVKWIEVPEAQKEKVRNLLLNDPNFTKFYQLLEKASGMKCQFLKRKDYEKGAELALPHLASLRSCARMLAARADLLAEKGAVDSGLHDCLTGLKISGSLSGEPTIITRLVVISIDQTILTRMEEIIKKGEAGSETYRTLMETVAGKQNSKMLHRALLTERVVFAMMEFARWKEKIKDGKSQDKMVEMLKPDLKAGDEGRISETIKKDPVGFIEENELAYLQTMAKLLVLSKLSYLKAKGRIAGLQKEVLESSDEKMVLTKFLVTALTRLFLNEARFDAQLGNAEIALACHLYKTEYKKYPAGLKELSLEFLPKTVLDPFSRKEHIYHRTAKGFKIYSVGENLKDDGGQQAGKPSRKWEEGDIVWEE